MANDVRIRLRTPITGSGFTSSGTVSTTKTMVCGDINITTYTAQGEPVTPRDLGLTAIDGIFLSVVTVDSTATSQTSITSATYDHTAEQVLCWDGNGGVTVPATSARVRFLAFGDSAAAPELT